MENNNFEQHKQDIFDRILPIIVKRLDIDAQRVTPEATLHDLGADSLDLVEIILDIEEQLHIEIDDESAENLKNVDDVVTYVAKLSA